MSERQQIYALVQLPLSKRREMLGEFYGSEGSDFERVKAGIHAARAAGKLGDILAALAPERGGVSEPAPPADWTARDYLALVLPMAKSHAYRHPVGDNVGKVQAAEDFLSATPPPPVPAQAESGEVDRTRCPIGITPESRSICSAGSCYDCLADRCVWSSDLRNRAEAAEAKCRELEGEVARAKRERETWVEQAGRNAAAADRLNLAAQAARDAKLIVDLWFEPWGAAKAAKWEDLSGDETFNPEAALRLIQAALHNLEAI